MASRDSFDAFRQTFKHWDQITRTLPIKRGPEAQSAFESDLDHLIDYVRPIAADASAGSTQYDYPKVAAEYLADIRQMELEIDDARLSGTSRDLYVHYLDEFRRLLTELASLPVPDEGHLGFRHSALSAFRFLTEEHGFEAKETSPITVCFRRGDMFVELTHSPQCPGAGVEIGLKSGKGDVASILVLDDLWYSLNGDVVFDYDRFDLSTPSGIEKFLESAASVVRQFSVLLGGSSKAWSELQRKSDERDDAYSRMRERLQRGQG
jgi:hypothetical protein